MIGTLYKKCKGSYIFHEFKRYYIRYNWRKPYIVYIKGNDVIIYRKTIYNICKPNDRYNKFVKKYKASKIFIGRSSKNMSIAKVVGDEYNGNTILIKISDNRYVYIGHSIYSFKSRATIERYASPIGDEDIPYPYARDSNGTFYLLKNKIMLHKVPKIYKENVYSYYKAIDSDIGDMYNVKKAVINFKPFDFTYSASIKKTNKRPIYILSKNGKKYVISDEIHKKMMKRFERISGVETLDII